MGLDHPVVAARLVEGRALTEHVGDRTAGVVRLDADRVGVHVTVSLHVAIGGADGAKKLERRSDAGPVQLGEQDRFVASLLVRTALTAALRNRRLHVGGRISRRSSLTANETDRENRHKHAAQTPSHRHLHRYPPPNKKCDGAPRRTFHTAEHRTTG